MRAAPHPLTLRQLQYAVAVADERSFRRAAERCHVSQPSLSAQIAELERGLGVQLFERDKRGVLVTAAGALLLARARRVLIEADELTEGAQRLSDPLSGELRIGVIPTVAPYLLPEVAMALREALPRLAFTWVEEKTSTLLARLANGEIDAALVALESELGDVHTDVIGRDAFVLAAAPGHALAAARGPAGLAELEGAEVLLLDDGHCFRTQALAVCARAGAAELAFRATSLTTLVQMVAGGAAVTLLPALALPTENRNGALVVRAFGAKGPARTLALVRRPTSPLAETVSAVAKTLRAVYAKRDERPRR